MIVNRNPSEERNSSITVSFSVCFPAASMVDIVSTSRAEYPTQFAPSLPCIACTVSTWRNTTATDATVERNRFAHNREDLLISAPPLDLLPPRYSRVESTCKPGHVDRGISSDPVPCSKDDSDFGCYTSPKLPAGRTPTMKLRLRPRTRIASCLFCLVSFFPNVSHADQYKNFRVAVYIPIFVVAQMKDPNWLQSNWDIISKQVKVDKVYIETYRSHQIADEQLLEQIKKFFTDHGVQVAGGIAFTGDEARQFESFCYTDPQDREYVKRVSELTARHFDEIILDDFFFVNSKRDSDIAVKGDKSWTQFRLDLMDDAARTLVIGPIKAVNPKAKVIIKFPNWYEHFPGLGFDLDKEPKLFDGIYTGTETRDPNTTDQHLQQYESYQIFRYFANIKPGGNGGGWVDMFGIRYIDRYAEQLW